MGTSSLRVIPNAPNVAAFMALPGKYVPSHMAAYHELQSIHVGNALDQATCGWHRCMSSTPSLARES